MFVQDVDINEIVRFSRLIDFRKAKHYKGIGTR